MGIFLRTEGTVSTKWMQRDLEESLISFFWISRCNCIRYWSGEGWKEGRDERDGERKGMKEGRNGGRNEGREGRLEEATIMLTQEKIRE